MARLIAAPLGFVGYEEGGQLTEKVRRHPYAVVQLDEIEKAHPEVFNIPLQILEDGHRTDAKGRTVDFRNAVLVITGIVGSSTVSEQAGRNPDRARQQAIEALRAVFRPEFLNPVDDIVLSSPLGRDHQEKILALLFRAVSKLLIERNITLEVSPAA